MRELDEIIERICNYEDINNSFGFYRRIIDCIDECLNLINPDLLSENALIARKKAKNIWGNEYNASLLHELYVDLREKHSVYEDRYYVYDALKFYLCSYEEYPDDERANALDYFVANLKRAGADKDLIYQVIVKHFPEFR